MSVRLLFVDVEEDLVTNRQYWEFCDETGRDRGKTTGRPEQPVTNISWYDCMDYACWKTEKTGIPYRLPTEDELKAAEEHIPDDADFSAWPLKELPDIGQTPHTNSTMGHRDLVGVVYQWTMRPEDKDRYNKAYLKYLADKKEWEEQQAAQGGATTPVPVPPSFDARSADPSSEPEGEPSE
jgi:formylglycine-generating enzyme required for sulfatase activity